MNRKIIQIGSLLLDLSKMTHTRYDPEITTLIIHLTGGQKVTLVNEEAKQGWDFLKNLQTYLKDRDLMRQQWEQEEEAQHYSLWKEKMKYREQWWQQKQVEQEYIQERKARLAREQTLD